MSPSACHSSTPTFRRLSRSQSTWRASIKSWSRALPRYLRSMNSMPSRTRKTRCDDSNDIDSTCCLILCQQLNIFIYYQILSRLYMHKLEDWLSSAKHVPHLCVLCGQLYPQSARGLLPCPQAPVRIDVHGQMRARHQPDPEWALQKVYYPTSSSPFISLSLSLRIERYSLREGL